MKNRNREPYSFANINLLGRCNVNCYFCLGKDLEQELVGQNQLKTHFTEWLNFQNFLIRCRAERIHKIYITGQNTDSLLYVYLRDLINYLHKEGFQVGLRTNGYLATTCMDVINLCDLSVGYSIHSLKPEITKSILGRNDIPNWDIILDQTKHPRVSIVLTRWNEYDIFHTLTYLSSFKHLRYVQVRRVSTDRRLQFLQPDIDAYERIYTYVTKAFGPPTRKFVTDAEEYAIAGLPVVFWRTVKTSVNSLNYFTDGTCSELYFVVEGYLKYQNTAFGV